MKKTRPEPGLSAEVWDEEGRMYVRRGECNTWAMGDWLLRGQALEIDLGFKRSMRITGLSRSFLYSMAQTSKFYEVHERCIEALSWGAHRALMAEKDPEAFKELKARAIAERWAVHEIERYFRGRRERPSKSSRSYENRQVVCPNCQHVFPLKGNKVIS